VLQTALMYERAVMGASNRRRSAEGGGPRPAGPEAPAPVPDLVLVELARARGRHADPPMRQRLAHLWCLRTVNDWNNARARAAMSQGSSTPLASLGKLAMSSILHTAASIQAELLGAEGMLAGEDDPVAADTAYALLNAFFTSIGGGTDQVQRNIIGERILGLPKEPEVDRDVPFRDVLRPPGGGRA
jgi:hypothetical protein